jgi:predicted metal-dependent HD superfamily phosphohydrolase
MKRLDLTAFVAACRGAGWQDASIPTWHERLIAAYSEPQRAYHTLQHLNECLMALDQTVAHISLAEAGVIELALWFHDAVFDPRASDNEERSAELARSALASTRTELAEVIARLILDTKRHEASSRASEWLLDIDLAILGQPAARFDEFEAQIRQEYAWVPIGVYAAERGKIMANFLSRDRLYQTGYFHSRLDAAARNNLQRLMERLR